MARAVQPWHRLPREVMESPSLKEFESHVDVTFGNNTGGTVGLDVLKDLFQPE